MSTTPEEKQPTATPEIIAGVVALMLAGATITATAGAIATLIGAPFAIVVAVMSMMRAGYPKNQKLTRHRMNLPTIAPSGKKTPTQIVNDANNTYRAAFLFNSVHRVAAAPDADAQLAREASYWQSHVAASNRRMMMARRAEEESAKHPGDLLGWYATLDARTSPECRAADGRNFYASSPPLIGYPGAVHLYCRCVPGPPHVGAKMVDSSMTVRNSDSASGFERDQR